MKLSFYYFSNNKIYSCNSYSSKNNNISHKNSNSRYQKIYYSSKSYSSCKNNNSSSKNYYSSSKNYYSRKSFLQQNSNFYHYKNNGRINILIYILIIGLLAEVISKADFKKKVFILLSIETSCKMKYLKYLRILMIIIECILNVKKIIGYLQNFFAFFLFSYFLETFMTQPQNGFNCHTIGNFYGEYLRALLH